MATAPSQAILNEIQDLYVAFYDRPADQGGLNYWAGVVQNNFSGNVGGIVNYFVEQPEASSFYNANYEIINTTDGFINPTYIDQFLDQVYQNLFNRAPDSGGLQYWENVYNIYHMSAGQLVLDIIGGAQGSDITAISNKLQAANTFTSAMGASYTSSDLGAAYSFNSIISATTASTTLSNINTSFVNNFVNEYSSTNYTLTTGTDFLIGANTTSNTFNGSPETWTSGDSITGASKASNNFTLTDDRTSPTAQWNLNPSGVSVNNIQNVNVTSQTNLSIDTTSWSGVTSLTVNANDSYSGISYNKTTIITATATTNIDFTNVNLGSATDTITGGKTVTVIEQGADGGKVNVIGLNGTASVSVTQSLAPGDSYASVYIYDYNSDPGDTTRYAQPVTTASLGTITTVSLDGVVNAGAIITDNALTTLTVNDAAYDLGSPRVKITDNSSVSGVPTALTLNVNNDTLSDTTTIQEQDSNSIGQYTTLNVVTGNQSSNLSLIFNALNTLNVSGKSTLTLYNITAPALTTISIF